MVSSFLLLTKIARNVARPGTDAAEAAATAVLDRDGTVVRYRPSKGPRVWKNVPGGGGVPSYAEANTFAAYF